ncbi:hypothetical protein JMUB7537_28290 [Staphylococcus aureus]
MYKRQNDMCSNPDLGLTAKASLRSLAANPDCSAFSTQFTKSTSDP